MTPLKLALVAAHLHRDALRALPGLGLYRAGAVPPRETLRLAVVRVERVLFYAGTAFAYFVVFPLMFKFLTMTTPVGVKMMTDISSYLDFVVLLFFAFGVAFETPVATVLLVATGLVSITTLKKNRGYVLLGIFVVAAFLTPPDAISQTAMAVPMYLLYEVGIVFAQVLLRDKLKTHTEADAEAAREEAAQSSK